MTTLRDAVRRLMLHSSLTGDTAERARERCSRTERIAYRGHTITPVWQGPYGYRKDAGIYVYAGFTWAASPGATWTETIDEAKELVDLQIELGHDPGAKRFWTEVRRRQHVNRTKHAWLHSRLAEAMTLRMCSSPDWPSEAKGLDDTIAMIRRCIESDDREHRPGGEAESFLAKMLAGEQPCITIGTDGNIVRHADGTPV